MTTHAIADSATMLRRSLRHTVRYPVMMIAFLIVPIILLLLFLGVFGGSVRTGVAGPGSGGSYIDYIVPGIILIVAGYGCSTTALAVNKDMTEGIIARFRTMNVARTAVLTGHVVGAVLRTLIAAALVVGVAFALGFRPHAGAPAWLAAAGLVLLFTLALTWLAVASGLAAKTPDGTTSFALLAQLLPFVSSAFVPTGSMAAGVRWFAANEPFTPIINTIRGLLLGGPVGHAGIIAVAWCVGLTLVGYVWSRMLFNRDPSH
jgi:ABC-2 type transport system permease protein